MRTVLTYSGGLDSTVALYYLLSKGDEVRCLSVNYGQRHARELQVASNICRKLLIPHVIAELHDLRFLFGGSSQTDDTIEVPHGHYEEESMKKTVVPNRNMVLLSLATSWAIATKSKAVVYAAHAGDHAIYPDCRREFADAMVQAINLCDWTPPYLYAPFINKSKADIVKIGHHLKVPFEETYSCYEGQPKHCGKCGTCVERKEAFKLAVVPDPTIYKE